MAALATAACCSAPGEIASGVDEEDQKRKSRPPAAARTEHLELSAADSELDALAVRARAGDRNAAAKMCAASFAGINRYLRGALPSTQDAEDATQQVLAQALSALPRYRADGTPFRGWLFTIAHNHAVNLNRQRRRSSTLAPAELGQIQERNCILGSGVAPEERDSFRTLITALPRAQQQVLVLLYQYDMTAEQAAATLHRTPESVRRLHKRARDSLREIVLAQSRL